ncbi:PREDICTED: serine proteases 1/2-like, partial [Drosophila arizonae]|uniref:Serine proteases 1/2-like n=1 Tax=Drosophila arizonae TaxID=7263 RepID=A0ABM1P0U1_DROAR
ASTLSNDISVIKLSVPIELNEYIQPAQLPIKQESYNAYDGEQAIASGWGKISDSRWCQWCQQLICWYGGILTSNVMCIKTTGGTSTCNGDSGGPLVLADSSNTLIGATSFGIVVGWPGVFVRIASYLDWFENNIGVVSHGY